MIRVQNLEIARLGIRLPYFHSCHQIYLMQILTISSALFLVIKYGSRYKTNSISGGGYIPPEISVSWLFHETFMSKSVYFFIETAFLSEYENASPHISKVTQSMNNLAKYFQDDSFEVYKFYNEEITPHLMSSVCQKIRDEKDRDTLLVYLYGKTDPEGGFVLRDGETHFLYSNFVKAMKQNYSIKHIGLFIDNSYQNMDQHLQNPLSWHSFADVDQSFCMGNDYLEYDVNSKIVLSQDSLSRQIVYMPKVLLPPEISDKRLEDADVLFSEILLKTLKGELGNYIDCQRVCLFSQYFETIQQEMRSFLHPIPEPVLLRVKDIDGNDGDMLFTNRRHHGCLKGEGIIQPMPKMYIPRKDIQQSIVHSLTTTHQMVCLVGPLGSGRSTSLLGASHSPEIRQFFKDGIYRIVFPESTVTGARPAIVQKELWKHLQSKAMRATSTMQIAEKNAEAIGKKKILIILEGVSRKEDISAFTFNNLCPNTRIAFTCQPSSPIVEELEHDEVLKQKIKMILVTPFSEEEAMQLFSRRIDGLRAKIPSRASDLAKICLYHPLSLSICASLLSLEQKLSASDIEQHWNRIFQLIYHTNPDEIFNEQHSKLPEDEAKIYARVHQVISVCLDTIQNEYSDLMYNLFNQLVVFPERKKIPLPIIAMLWQKLDNSKCLSYTNVLKEKGLLELEKLSNHSLQKHSETAETEMVLVNLHPLVTEHLRILSAIRSRKMRQSNADLEKNCDMIYQHTKMLEAFAQKISLGK